MGDRGIHVRVHLLSLSPYASQHNGQNYFTPTADFLHTADDVKGALSNAFRFNVQEAHASQCLRTF